MTKAQQLVKDAMAKVVSPVACQLFANNCGIDLGVYGIELTEKGIHIHAPDASKAGELSVTKGGIIARKCWEWGYPKVEIWCSSPNPVPVSLKASPTSDIRFQFQSGAYNIMSNSAYILPEQGITLADAYVNELPVWIIEQATQKVLFANPVALAANERPPGDILGSEINALWEQETLEALTQLVNVDRAVYNHTNTGYRWKRAKKGDILWTREKTEFNVDYFLTTYLGVPCRYELVRDAVPV
jgi:hypothetical protein